MKKISIKIKEIKKIDLKQYALQVTISNGKQHIIDVFTQLVEYTEKLIYNLEGEEKKKNQFRLNQFKKVISTLRSFPGEISSGAQAKELQGIGKGIADRIDEIINTGTLSELSKCEKCDTNSSIISELLTVTGIGESNAKKFVEMGVVSLCDLYEKVNKGTIKVTHHMQIGLKYYHDFQQKISFDEMVELGKIMKSIVGNIYPDDMIEICGSHRRHKAFSGDIDVLMTNPLIKTDDDMIKSKSHHLKDVIIELKKCGFIVDDLTSQGDTKYMGVCINKNGIGRHIDIRYVPFDSYYPAILYFTGSMILNKMMRTIALQKNYTLNEYGLYHLLSDNKSEKISISSEKEIFDILNIEYLLPVDRDL